MAIHQDMSANIELKFEDIFEDTPDLVCILNLKHTIIRANHAMVERIGLTQKELIGKKCCSIFHNTNTPPESCPQVQLMLDGLKHSSEVWSETLNSWLDVAVSPLHDSHGNLSGSIHIARDITRRKRVEMELAHVNRVLRMLNETNQTLIRVNDEIALLNDICKISVEIGGYRMALVGLTGKDRGETIQVMAKAEAEKDNTDHSGL